MLRLESAENGQVNRSAALAAPAVTPHGFAPADLVSAYKFDVTGGAGRVLAIVDPMDYANAEADLAVYRTQYGLPACTTANGCFKKVDQTGALSPLPARDAGWASEIALDLDMASASCPLCNHGPSYPASSPYVIAVGGTSLAPSATARGWSESAWGSTSNANDGTGSGCSIDQPKPAFQTDTLCARRTMNDVAVVADPNTGVAVYDSLGLGGWSVFGSTSIGPPLIAGAFLDAGTPAAGSYPAQYLYADPSGRNDITTGLNGLCPNPVGLCHAEVGYDGPTGLGTPNGELAFTAPNLPAPALVPGSTSVVEPSSGTTTMQIPVTLSHATPQTVTAHWSTLAVSETGYAIPGTDYTATTGTVTFAPGETTKTVTITINHHAAMEPNEYVVVSFTTPTNATIGGYYGLGFGLILNL